MHLVTAEAKIKKCSISFRVVKSFFVFLSHEFILIYLFSEIIFVCFIFFILKLLAFVCLSHIF